MFCLLCNLAKHMIVSTKKGTPIQTPKYQNPYYGDPRNRPLIGSGAGHLRADLFERVGLAHAIELSKATSKTDRLQAASVSI